MAVNRYFDGSGYWALILGGSSGMGLATAKRMAEAGLHICILHRDRRKDMVTVTQAFDAIRAYGVQFQSFNMDAVRLDRIYEVVAHLKQTLGAGERIRLLLHAISRGNLKQLAPLAEQPPVAFETEAGLSDPSLVKPYEALHRAMKAGHEENPPLASRQDFQLTLDAMALSWYDWVKAIFEAGLFAPDARVIGLTSEGSAKAWPHYAAVGAAKATLEALCRSMALAFAPHGIRCNVIQAGITDTPSLRMIAGSDQLKLHALLRNPFNRLTRPEDVANVVYLLCRDEAAWINGAIIPVDGGERNS